MMRAAFIWWGEARTLSLCSGFKVYPWEVEARIGSHLAVQHVAMVGVADPRLGEASCACVVPSKKGPGSGMSRVELSRTALAEGQPILKGVAASKVDVPAGLPLTSVVL